MHPDAECMGGFCKFCSNSCRKDKPHYPCCAHRSDRVADCQRCFDRGLLPSFPGTLKPCSCLVGREMEEFFE